MKIEISNRLLILLALFLASAIGTFSVYSKKDNPLATQKPAVAEICITDAKMATGLDDQFMPAQVTDVFPRDTKRVVCWFSWENAVPKTEMKAAWNYEIDDVNILTSDFRIPRRKGFGGISLTMPPDKVLPVGAYRIDIIAKNKILKSITFKVK